MLEFSSDCLQPSKLRVSEEKGDDFPVDTVIMIAMHEPKLHFGSIDYAGAAEWLNG